MYLIQSYSIQGTVYLILFYSGDSVLNSPIQGTVYLIQSYSAYSGDSVLNSGTIQGTVYLIQGVRRWLWGIHLLQRLRVPPGFLRFLLAAVLLRHGANVHIKDDDGVSVVDGAQSGSNAEILDLVMAAADGTLHPTPAPD